MRTSGVMVRKNGGQGRSRGIRSGQGVVCHLSAKNNNMVVRAPSHSALRIPPFQSFLVAVAVVDSPVLDLASTVASPPPTRLLCFVFSRLSSSKGSPILCASVMHST